MFQENENQPSRIPAHTLRIDRSQASTQLEALDYNQGDVVCTTAFLSKENPRYTLHTGRKADKLNWEQIEGWQAQGYGVYIVVNGGGQAVVVVSLCDGPSALVLAQRGDLAQHDPSAYRLREILNRYDQESLLVSVMMDLATATDFKVACQSASQPTFAKGEGE